MSACRKCAPILFLKIFWLSYWIFWCCKMNFTFLLYTDIKGPWQLIVNQLTANNADLLEGRSELYFYYPQSHLAQTLILLRNHCNTEQNCWFAVSLFVVSLSRSVDLARISMPEYLYIMPFDDCILWLLVVRFFALSIINVFFLVLVLG